MNEVVEIKIPPGTVVKINGIPLEVCSTATALTAIENRGLLPDRVINHTNSWIPPNNKKIGVIIIRTIALTSIIVCLLSLLSFYLLTK